MVGIGRMSRLSARSLLKNVFIGLLEGLFFMRNVIACGRECSCPLLYKCTVGHYNNIQILRYTYLTTSNQRHNGIIQLNPREELLNYGRNTNQINAQSSPLRLP